MKTLGIGIKVETVIHILCSEEEYRKIPKDLFLDNGIDYLKNNDDVIKLLTDISIIDAESKLELNNKYLKECQYIKIVVKDNKDEYTLPPSTILTKIKDPT